MTELRAVVYDPPLADYPHVATVFGVEGEVLVAKVVPSREEGEAFLREVMSVVQAEVDAAMAQLQ